MDWTKWALAFLFLPFILIFLSQEQFVKSAKQTEHTFSDHVKLSNHILS